MSEPINEATVLYFGQAAKVNCDRNCAKAWGHSQRPRVQLSDDPDDYYYRPDDELAKAPRDPGTYEGSDAKPLSPDDFPTKWCVRECERCHMSKPGESLLPLAVRRFDRPVYNRPPHNRPPEAPPCPT